MRVKLESTEGPHIAADGGSWHGYPVVASFPGDPNIVVDVGDMTWDQVQALMSVYQAAGNVVDYRPEHADYYPLGFADEPVYGPRAIGDTFGLHGMSEAVRAMGLDGADVVLNIVDTGVDSRHVAFAGVTVVGEGKDRDQHGHGTHCASTAGSAWGIARKAIIYAGLGLPLPGGGGTESDIANAIRAGVNYAIAQGKKCVVSLSLGGPPSSVMDAGVVYAAERGAVVFTAAGNGGSRQTRPGSPARASDWIVMACDRAGNHASFTDGINWPDLQNRVSLNGVSIDAARANSGSGIVAMSGTSMACPHAAGFAALVMARTKSRQVVMDYFLRHRSKAPGGLGFAILADFAEVTPPPPPPPPPPGQPVLDVLRGELVFRGNGTLVIKDGDVWPIEAKFVRPAGGSDG